MAAARPAATSGASNRSAEPGRRRKPRSGAAVRRPAFVDDRAFERARAPLVELEPAGERLDAHLEVLHLDAHARGFEDEVVHDLERQLIAGRSAGQLLRLGLRLQRVELRLDVQRLNQRVRVEEQLQDRQQQPAHPADRRAVRFEQRRVLEREVRPHRRLDWRPHAAEFLEQVGADAARIEELLELDRRQLADLLLGVVDAALLADPRADLLHDLLDVDRIGADVEIGHMVVAEPRARPTDK